jgi:hypothetical protein
MRAARTSLSCMQLLTVCIMSTFHMNFSQVKHKARSAAVIAAVASLAQGAAAPERALHNTLVIRHNVE